MAEIDEKTSQGPLRVVNLRLELEYANDILNGAIVEAWIFGSRRHNTRSPRSDIDVIVTLDDSRQLTLQETFELRAAEPYIDWFTSAGGIATSIANGSQISAPSLADLLSKVDALPVWKTSWIGPPAMEEHAVLTVENPAMSVAELGDFHDPYRRRYMGLVVTALEIEYTAVKAVFEPHTILSATDSVATINTSAGARQIYLHHIGRMGSVEAAASVSRAVAGISPDWLILCGITAGLNGKTQLGDVLVPQAVYDYELGKVRTTKKKQSDFEGSPAFFNASDKLHAIATAKATSFVASEAAKALIPHKWYARRRYVQHVRTDGVIASGSKVIADAKRAKEVAALHRKVEGIEMESVGIAVVARRNHIPDGFLTVKAVSDLADSRKNDDWHAFAARASAEFARSIIKST